MDHVVQMNASLVEEATAGRDQHGEPGTGLAHAVAQFRVEETPDAATAAAPRPRRRSRPAGAAQTKGPAAGCASRRCRGDQRRLERVLKETGAMPLSP
jgi:hypothetical protein